jgi:cell division initiation protein
MDEAYLQAEKTVAEMQREVSNLGQECQRLEQQLDTLVRDLHHLASDALDKVEKARTRPKGSTAAILSRAARVQVERPKQSFAEPTPEPVPTMQVSTPASLPSVAAVATPSIYVDAEYPALQPVARPEPLTPAAAADQPQAYNPKPGQQPDPGTAPSPDIERPGAPAENPGISPAPHVDPPAPSDVPHPGAPRVDPTEPEIRPIGPDRPEITQPSPITHPGMEKVAPFEVAVAEKSFFDEI